MCTRKVPTAAWTRHPLASNPPSLPVSALQAVGPQPASQTLRTCPTWLSGLTSHTLFCSIPEAAGRPTAHHPHNPFPLLFPGLLCPLYLQGFTSSQHHLGMTKSSLQGRALWDLRLFAGAVASTGKHLLLLSDGQVVSSPVRLFPLWEIFHRPPTCCFIAFTDEYNSTLIWVFL